MNRRVLQQLKQVAHKLNTEFIALHMQMWYQINIQHVIEFKKSLQMRKTQICSSGCVGDGDM